MFTPEEQFSASEQITRSLDKVSSLAEQTVEAMNLSTSAIEDLVRQAEELEPMIGELRSDT